MESRCLLMASKIEAVKEFKRGISQVTEMRFSHPYRNLFAIAFSLRFRPIPLQHGNREQRP